MSSIRVKKLNENAIIPTYGSAEAAGADLYACLDEPIVVQPGQVAWVSTGIALEVPKGCAGLVYARSGMACKRGLAPANKVGVVDSDYRGEVKVVLLNHSNEPQTIQPGERIAQFVITPVLTPAYEEVTDLDETDRGVGGFGSTGKESNPSGSCSGGVFISRTAYRSMWGRASRTLQSSTPRNLHPHEWIASEERSHCYSSERLLHYRQEHS